MTKKRQWLQVKHPGARWGIAAVAAIVFLCGLLWQRADLLGGGAVVLCLVLRRVGSSDDQHTAARRRQRRRFNERHHEQEGDDAESGNPIPGDERRLPLSPRVLERPELAGAPKSTDALVDELLDTGRYSLLLRPQTKQHLTQVHIVRAVRQLDEAMALVPAGRVLLGQLAEQSNSTCGAVDADPRMTERNLAEVETVYLDRHCVTNDEYQQFVDSGGYEQLEFWHEEALPALLDFVDQSGVPGPRYWYDGQFPDEARKLPVVGVSWYEAAAYARWVGKRLPTDAEWTKAGAWPVESSPGRIAQRRYPWGESFDVRRANIYGSGDVAPAPVDEFPAGVSVGGVHQLIGNVWEWTTTPLAKIGDRTLHVSESIMSIRGGAFDTYFENQATCHYQSGEHPLSRRANIGFRLALPMADLEAPEEEEDAPQYAAVLPVTGASADEEEDAALTVIK
jgi:gamma-glutamyl hercynylcysteine S-oxide synthase